jgi:hypothetical protein
MPWLKEMEVVEAVRYYLERERGYEINRIVQKSTEHGTDIIATSPKQKTVIRIEAKGQTSSRGPKGSKKGSSRYGKEFNTNQKQDHLGRALLKSLSYLQEGYAAGIALPGDGYDRNMANSIERPLRRLGIVVFLVDEKHKVITMGNLPK